MARKIFKYQLETTDFQKLSIPKLKGTDSFKEQFLKIDTQDDTPYLWCLVDTDEKTREIELHIFGTGHSMPEFSKKDYLSSYLIENGALVFHVFIKE